MNYSSSNFSSKRGFPAGNPIANALVIVVGALAIGVSLVLGFVAFVILASLLVVFSAFVGLRLWWFNRKFRRRRENYREQTGNSADGFIEGEYRVVDDERAEPGRDKPE